MTVATNSIPTITRATRFAHTGPVSSTRGVRGERSSAVLGGSYVSVEGTTSDAPAIAGSFVTTQANPPRSTVAAGYVTLPASVQREQNASAAHGSYVTLR